MNQTIASVFRYDDLEHSVLLGYYGGGNYGDELLLEVLMNLFEQHSVDTLTVAYQHPERYPTYHHEFGYERVEMTDKKAVLQTVIKNKNIIIGGGGLWGLDVNPNIFLLSCLLFVSRWLLFKRVYLLGVGYYDSTSKLGRASAWLAAKAAGTIIARDQESLQNFKGVSRHVALDKDLAWYISKLNLKPYQPDLAELDGGLRVAAKTLFITLRRFKSNQKNNYIDYIESCLANNQQQNIIVALMEPCGVDPAGYELLLKWQQQFGNVQILDFSYNPLALFLFFQKHSHQLSLIGPQFHVILTAHLTGVPFLPLAYDNKVLELFKQIAVTQPLLMKDLSPERLQTFINNAKQTI